MKYANQAKMALSVVALLALLASCAPKITFYVTRPPLLSIKEVETVSIGSFENIKGEEIALPEAVRGSRMQSRSALEPTIARFQSNDDAAEMVRAMLVAGLSESGQYRLANTGGISGGFSGSVPNPSTTGIVNARVKYYEFTDEDSEKIFYLLLATKGGLNIRDQALLVVAKTGVTQAAERSGKGFEVDTPFIEKIAAMEVEFDLVRQSNQEKITETQRIRSYFVKKWGGKDDTTHLPGSLKQVIVSTYQEDESLLGTLQTKADQLQLALMDPDEFLARGGKLKKDPSVPLNSLGIQTRLARDIVGQYLKRVSQYTEETTLEVASGDAIGANFIKGNAYEKAINRLENIERTEDDSFNLALAYESIAEYPQAAKYYQEALDKKPGNPTYRQALKRVTNR
ncbi:MAG: hypothetical protein GY866_41230 [Proteobacteria bacterium]|nr:hypothetical protein [Pseudomonadota bacterium]